jgi:hypothetical protein
MNYPKLYIGPVSKNTVDAVVNVANSRNIRLGLIPSRRQVDFNGGYVGWSTSEFSNYVKDRTNNVILERDHGGSNQGHSKDSGVISFLEDAKNFDIIHIDPFKSWSNILEVASETVIHLQYLHYTNPNLLFEIGTESGIMPYSVEKCGQFLDYVKKNLPDEIFSKIIYLVVQGGTKVRSGKNIGNASYEQLSNFIELSKSHGMLSKEHNGDYLDIKEIKQKFDLGLSSINIAPEFGSIESLILWSKFNDNDKNKFFKLVLGSGRWQKWFPQTFTPEKNPEILIKMCGHYVFEDLAFKDIKSNYDLELEVQSSLEGKIIEIMDAIK